MTAGLPMLAALGLVLMLALGLRGYRLDAQSLWYDEGVSAFMTTRGAPDIARAAAADIHPPLYYWLLAAWAVPFGRGELALRGFSVVCGTLAVWATWRLGQTLFGSAVGLLAAGLLAISPLAVQYGQEVRMYALASLLAVGATWAYVSLRRALLDEAVGNRHRALLPVAYAACAVALLYTHYYGVLVIAAHHAHLGATILARRRWRILPGWLLANGLVTLAYLPWLPYALRQTGYYPGLGTPQSPWALLIDMVNVLSIGLATTRFEPRAGLAPFVLLAGAGLLLAPRARGTFSGDSADPATDTAEIERAAHGDSTLVREGGRVEGDHPRLLVLLWLALPILGILLLSRTRPLYEPRFLLLVAPAWALLLGAGAIGIGTRLAPGLRRLPAAWTLPWLPHAAATVCAAIALLALLVPTARSLGSYFFDPAYARDDYRGLASHVGGMERPGDAVVLTAPGQAEIFGYYYRGQSDVYPLPAQRPIDVADARARLNAIAGGHRRVWLVRWAASEADPADNILRWLETYARRADSQFFGRVQLRLYDLTVSA